MQHQSGARRSPALAPRTLALALLGALCASTASAAAGGDLLPGDTTRVADPKLTGGGVETTFYLYPPGSSEQVVVEALQGPTVVRTIADADMTGTVDPLVVNWDGLDDLGAYVDTGDYTVRVRLASGGGAVLEDPVSIVRLGVTEIEAQPTRGEVVSTIGNEFQMVYFKKNNSYAWYVTPAIHEYLNRAHPTSLSDLDLNDGSPRTPAPLHTATDEPVMDGVNYEQDRYNYPLCYLAGAVPRFELTFGATSTTTSGTQQGVGYPVPGVLLRLTLSDQYGDWRAVSDAVSPGGTAVLVGGHKLPGELASRELQVDHRYQYSTDGGAQWHDVLGESTTHHRFYTVIDQPNFSTQDSGLQYSGPWVEVVDYIASWGDALDMPTADDAGVMAAGIQGFFGQQGPLTTAIEGVIYDAYPLGGDGGANHYFQNGSHRIQLADLLDGHSNGVYVNCSDCAGSTSTMIAMTGVDNVQLVHLGNMQLKAIWGIGSPAYTTNLWGGSHGFSYHKIITREGGVTVSDACMSLDEDGNPTSTPGAPGYNCDRPWDGQPDGYNYLSSFNNTSKFLQALPKLQ